METPSVPIPATRPSSSRGYFWLGLALGLLGPILYVAQLLAKQLFVPWYLPVLSTLGAGLMLVAAIRTHGLWRLIPGLLFVVFGLLTALGWLSMLSLSKVPKYAGSVEVGKPFPVFSTTLADGSTFDESSLKGKKQTVMVFFRGRW